MLINKKLKIALPGLLLLGLCFFLYSPILNHQFLLDDFYFLRFHDVFQIFKNPQLIFARNHHFEPLFNITNGILFPLLKQPALLYFVNIILFFINCYLLFLLIFIISRNYTVAFLTSILFCIHPMSAEIVLHITLNNILFSVVFMELGLIALFKHVKQKKHYYFYFLSLTCVCAALLFQEIAWFFPLYAAALLFYKTNDIKKTFFLCLPFFVLTGICVATWLLLAGSRTHIWERMAGFNLNPFELIANLFLLLIWYFYNLIIPYGIVFVYNTAPARDFIWFWNLLFLTVITVFYWILSRRFNCALERLGFIFFMGGLLFILPGSICRPEMGLVIQPYWFYFASAGLYLSAIAFIIKLGPFCNKYLFTALICSGFIFFIT
ncbi:MAG: hypothetical protein WCI27_11365, partial [Candidatus Omnitrophota bacterium]